MGAFVVPGRFAVTSQLEDVIMLLARTLMDEHGLQEWRVEWCDRLDGGLSGWCWIEPRVIVLSREHLLDTAARNVRECILHEIAHALVGTGNHDAAWWSRLLEIGGDGIWVMNNGRVTYAKPQNLESTPTERAP